ncbi:LPS export ABC transporter periplasmic protein LptC [Aeromonas cavernicola]|uniref:Lipopolysaccharide export system protein LptC n=1 Tax=Aeromonas cavernicola TaxID=1006623 RepID=A0A2H9U742_9GAMM|nr:LPS export ABC transporter periplasmic protein LptC [Aeromonas cavernicola]PJG59808.1 LPS export ABC transporter periplasmic protein LptC [Aeromonas cavernicola]
MSRQTPLFALLFLVALVAWQLSKVDPIVNETAKTEHYQPDFIAKGLVTTRFDINGKRTERLESDYAEYFQILEQATFEQPVVYLFDESGRDEWKVTAETGVLNIDDSVILREKVHLTGLQPTSFIATLDTPYLELDLVTQHVRSNQYVNIVGRDFQTRGVGLKGQLERKYFELLDQGHAIYFNEKR